MADIFGTAGADEIPRTRLSAGVTSDPLVAGTLGSANVIFAGAGDDRIQAGDFGDDIHGGAGDDRIFGGLGHDSLYGDAGGDLIVSGDNLPDEFGTYSLATLDGGDRGRRRSVYGGRFLPRAVKTFPQWFYSGNRIKAG